MEILTRTELKLRFEEIAEKIIKGAVFIYPTDTVYGIGCNALNKAAVKKIREIKTGRPTAPFSIIVPSLSWINKNIEIHDLAKAWIKKLPGPYTLIIYLKNKKAIAENVAPGVDTIGIRYPDHWFTSVIAKLNIPVVTTSANKTGEPFMTSLENLDPDLEKQVEFLIYEGPKEGRPSKIINTVKEEVLE
ncbi:MAG TPA: L-threonylcarbamoyladenylate synthase [Candidatus Nanoarchaeia archaeon]|nr:L-threonylcarbamoyladenylate synthase [Candidatus Nanoarchaeia archaeon]